MEEIMRSWPGWEVVRKIGSGSFGSVYEIRRETFGNVETAALKVISIPQSSADIEELYNDGYDDDSIAARYRSYLEDIVREYSLMVSMKGCTNVVYCDDLKYVQHSDGFGWDIYIKMELLTPLTRKLGRQITEDETVALGVDICSALMLCRERNIVHRDIKPQNIFVSRDGHHKLGDFGIAKTAEHTTSGTKVGTYKYMAPEVYLSQPYGSRADIYSLGLVLYWMLNERRTPFLPLPPQAPTAGMEDEARRRRFSGEALPAPANGSEALKRIVLKACAFDPKDRYATAGEMREELLKLRRGEPAVHCADEAPEEAPEEGTVGIFTAATAPLKPAEPVAAPAAEVRGILEEDAGQPYEEGTVGLFAEEKTEYAEDAATEYVRDEATVYVPRPQEPERKKKKGLLPLLLGLAAVVILILLLLHFCTGPEQDTNESTGTTSGTTAGTTAGEAADWSGWLDELPEGITAADYEIEELTLYRSCALEKTTSTTVSEMEGWELYHTAQGGTDYGDWSDWTTEQPAAAEGREIQSETRYRYRDKETATGTSATKEGWTLSDSTVSSGGYGAWSDWSETVVTATDTREVESKEQHSYSTTTYTCGEWGEWSDWQDGPGIYGSISIAGEPASTQVETRTLYPYYYYICPNTGYHNPVAACSPRTCGCIEDAGSYEYVVIYDTLSWDDATLSTVDGYEYADELTGDYGEYYYYDKTLETKTQYRESCRTVEAVTTWSEWSDTRRGVILPNQGHRTRTVYRYRDLQQTATYYFWRWGSWSAWSTEAASASDSREVQTADYYRSREVVTETTYYFQRWGDWTDFTEEAVAPSDTLQVETRTQYRYKAKEN